MHVYYIDTRRRFLNSGSCRGSHSLPPIGPVFIGRSSRLTKSFHHYRRITPFCLIRAHTHSITIVWRRTWYILYTAPADIDTLLTAASLIIIIITIIINCVIMIKMVRGPFSDPLLLTTNKHYAETMVGFFYSS